jgi:tRNA pseudouridine38-40 synthase
MIKEYYQALKENDKETLKQLLHPSLYGVRVYNESTYYDRVSFLNDLEKFEYQNVVVNNILNENHLVVEGTLNNQEFITKVKVKDNLIYKVFETIKTNCRRIRCTISYDGSLYSGYQKQINSNSVQGTFEYAMKKALKQDISIHSSGRTDKGVHAINQVIHFDIKMKMPLYNLRSLLNTYLPDSIYIKEINEENETFHSRYDVVEKTYCYKMNLKEYSPIQRNYEWFVPSLPIDKYKETMKQILGTHDFTSFTKTANKNKIRTIYNVQIEQKDDILYTYVTGNGFLRYMVRNIIGVAVKIANNVESYSMEELLEKKDVTLVKDKAPSNGLYLYNVKY